MPCRWRSSHGSLRVRHVNYATWYDTCHVTQVAGTAGQRGGILRVRLAVAGLARRNRRGRSCTLPPPRERYVWEDLTRVAIANEIESDR